MLEHNFVEVNQINNFLSFLWSVSTIYNFIQKFGSRFVIFTYILFYMTVF